MISQLALCGFTVVLTHAAVLFVLREAGAAPWEAFVVALIVPWAVALLLLRTPLSPVLCGVPRQRTHPLEPVTHDPHHAPDGARDRQLRSSTPYRRQRDLRPATVRRLGRRAGVSARV